jgi:hypothetical protein
LGTGLLLRSPAAGIEPAPSFRVTGYTAQIPNTHPEPSTTSTGRNDFSVQLNDLVQNIPAFFVEVYTVKERPFTNTQPHLK